MILRTSFILSALVSVSPLFGATYELDHSHTNVAFEVDHLAISSVEGRFDQYEGGFTIDDNTKALTSISGKAKATSINTNNEKRDKHLRSADFFDVEKFPEIVFLADEIKVMPGQSAKVTAKLTMKGITKAVPMEIKFRGTAKDPWGTEKAAFSARGEINRKDFGLTWNKALETGGLLVGETVSITLNVEGNKSTKPSTASTEPSAKQANTQKK